MSKSFDESVSASWGRFEGRLRGELASIGERFFSVSVMGAGEATAPYAQFAGAGGQVLAELSSNAFLDPGFALDASGEAALVALGWQRPQEDRPNWWYDVPRELADQIPAMVTGAFRLVFDVVDPEFLDWSVADEPAAVVTTSPTPVIGVPRDPEELVDLVEAALVAELGADEVCRDEDGDFPVETAAGLLWVRVSGEAPVVRVFTTVVVGVKRTRQAEIEVGILNRRLPSLKFYVADGAVVAAADLPATPFVSSQLVHLIAEMNEVLVRVVPDLATRIGGRAFFATDLEESA